MFDLLVATDSGAGEGDAVETAGAVDPENEEDNDDDDVEEGERNDDDDDDDDVDEQDDADGEDDEQDDEDDERDNDDDDEDLEGYEWMEEEQESAVAEGVELTKKPKALQQTAHAAGDGGEEYGVSRGIDFQDVNFVINFDFPTTAANYTHRIGRTARGSRVGTALSLISVGPSKATHSYKPLSKKEQLDAKIADRDWRVLQEVRHSQPKLGIVENDNILAAIQTPDMMRGTRDPVEVDESKMQPLPLNFNMKELDAFRYRVEDTLRSVTGVAVKEFRAAEIKREILNSSKLKSYFSENPNDLTVLRHDKSILHPIRQKPHLKNVPSYLIPTSMKSVVDLDTKKSKKRKAKTNVRGQSQEQRMLKSKHNDPLYQTLEDENVDVDEALEQPSEQESRVFSTKEASNLGRSVAGRREWQARHKKGKFNQKQEKKDSHRVKGTFSKAKQYK